MMENFLEVLTKTADRIPNTIAIVDQNGKRSISYKDFDILVGRVASKLRSLDFPAGSFIVIRMGRCAEYVAAYYGVIRAGLALVPAVLEYPEDRIQYIMNDCGSPLVITESFFEDIEEFEPYMENDIPWDQIVCMNYTSGSTGHPKGVYYSMKCVDENIKRSAMLFEGLDEIIAAAAVSMSFAAFSHDCLGPLYLGGTVHLLSEEVRKDVNLMTDYFNKHNIVCSGINPGMLRFFGHTRGLKRVLTFGQRVVGIHSDEHEIYNIYGMTEAFTALTYFIIDKKYDNTPVGKAFGGFTVEILDEEGHEVPNLTEGEICVTGYMAEGYYHKPEETAKAFEKLENGMTRLRTNDMGYKDENGNVVYVNRKDWMIKINGQRVEPFEVEAAICNVPGVKASIVKGFRDASGKPYLCAYYITDRKDVTREVIETNIREKLPPFMIPAYFVEMDEFPLTVSGKYDRKRLEAPQQKTYQRDYEAPADEKEKKICAAMEKILNLPKIGRNDDFFDIGGDSLSVMELIAMLDDDGLLVKDIVNSRTPKKIALKLNKGKYIDWENDAAYRQKTYELSEYQKHYFGYWESFPGIVLANTPQLISIPSGTVDPEKLAEAVYQVLRHHPSYSLVLSRQEDGSVVQRIAPEVVTVPEIIYFSEEEFEEEKQKMVQPFHLLDGPLYRSRIYCTPETIYLFLDMQHIISDKSSMDITVRDIFSVLKGEELAPDYYCSYLQYLSDIRSNIKNIVKPDETFDRHPEFDYDEDSCEIETIAVTLDVSAEEFKAKLSGIDATPLEFLIALTLRTMGRYNGSSREVVNWLYGGRNTRLKQDMTGLLITALPVAMDLSEFESMESIIQEVRRINQENMEYSDLSPGDFDTRPVVDDTITVNYIPCDEKAEHQWIPDGVRSESLINNNKANTNVFYVIMLEGDRDEKPVILFKYHASLYKKENVEHFINLYLDEFRKYV